MSRFQEMHDSTLSRSTLSDSKLMKDRLKTRFSKQLSESQIISNVFQKSPIEQVLRKIDSDDATKMQNDLWKVRISRYLGKSSLDMLRSLKDSPALESAQFFTDDEQTVTFLVRLTNEVR